MSGPNRPAIIEVSELESGYGSKVINRRVSFEVRRGEVFGILGGSGCGKTTILHNLIGLLPPLGGRIIIDGDDLAEARGRQRTELLRRFGVMYQQGALFGSMSLMQNVCLPLEEHTRLPESARRRIASDKLSLVGLAGYEGYLPDEISGGMAKRAAIARAMALDPKILFLDEPSAGLDPITSAGLDQLIVQLSGSLGITFVIVTHELPSIFAIIDRAILLDMDVGTVVADGNPKQLRDESEDPYVRRFLRRDPGIVATTGGGRA